MVIATSDSCNTLVSLDNGLKQVGKNVQSALAPEPPFVRTEILLPSDEYAYDDYDEDECDTSQRCGVEQNLYLPATSDVDAYLRTVPEVMETADELLANLPRYFCNESSETLLYVAQGEVGHAVPSQCDVIASDKATTCHILAFRSTNGTSTTPLVSLAHIDSASYEDCIRGMVQEHKNHHFASCDFDSSDDEEEKKQDSPVEMSKIEVDIHVMGGFEDADGSSREVSEFLINLLARLAEEEQSFVRMTLRTCAISSMNDTGHSCPIGRGLGIDLQTGEAFLAKVDRSVAGPCQELRSARLWSQNSERKKLSVIHTATTTNQLSISPFYFAPFKDMHKLMRLPDHIMLQYTSTSPDVEEADFCTNVRKTLEYIGSNKCCNIFGQDCDSPVTCRRVGTSNKWEVEA